MKQTYQVLLYTFTSYANLDNICFRAELRTVANFCCNLLCVFFSAHFFSILFYIRTQTFFALYSLIFMAFLYQSTFINEFR